MSVLQPLKIRVKDPCPRLSPFEEKSIQETQLSFLNCIEDSVLTVAILASFAEAVLATIAVVMVTVIVSTVGVKSTHSPMSGLHI